MAANVPSRMRPAAALAPLVFVVGCAVQVALAFGPSHVRSPAAAVGLSILVGIPVAVGCLLGARARHPGRPGAELGGRGIDVSCSPPCLRPEPET